MILSSTKKGSLGYSKKSEAMYACSWPEKPPEDAGKGMSQKR